MRSNNRFLKCAVFWSCALVVGYAVAQETDSQTSERQTAETQSVKFSSGETGTLHYWLYLPKMYEPRNVDDPNATDALPLIVFLHGRGECGDDLSLVKKWGPPKLVEKENSDFPFVLISPQCPKPGWDTVAVKQLIDAVVKKHNVDPNRIYVTGLSMGGFATWRLAAEYPDFFAAAIPICGGGNPNHADRLKSVPIWAFHGDADRVVSVKRTQSMVDSIKAAGGKQIKLTVYPRVGHNSWTQTYANPEIYKWLLNQTSN